jgi:hypothetical protein
MHRPFKEGDYVRYRYALGKEKPLLGRVDVVDQTRSGVVFVHWVGAPSGSGAWRPTHTLKHVDPLTALAMYTA